MTSRNLSHQASGSSATRRRDKGAKGAAVAVAAAVSFAFTTSMMTGCAKNPVTGHHQLMLITEEQEFAIGAGADGEVRKEYGAYLDSPALRGYVDDLGNRLARQGERPGLVFHFEVLNSPVINAFALPGGFVYVTRGMLERLSSEDELAMVVGHEVGHVTARHGAARISALYALRYGTLVGAVISPTTVGNYGDLINLALQVGLSKYSREQEAQADQLGVTYASEAGSRPEDAVTVMKILKWMEGKEPGALEKWFLSHPPADERIADVSSQVRALEQRDPSLKDRKSRRDVYLHQIDGMIVGQYNGSEMVVRDRYDNKELAVSLHVPAGWQVNLDPSSTSLGASASPASSAALVSALVSMTRSESGNDGDIKEFVLLEAEPMRTSMEAADVEKEFEQTLKRRGYTRTGGHQARTSQDIIAHIAQYKGRTAKGEPIVVYKAFLAHDKRKWIYTAVCEETAFAHNAAAYEADALDLRFLSPEQAAGLQPPRVRVIEAPAGSTWNGLASAYLAGATDAERLAFYNGMDANASIPDGTLLKIPPSLAVKP